MKDFAIIVRYKVALLDEPVIRRYRVSVDNKWDLYAAIGYLYTHSLRGIERISYCEWLPENEDETQYRVLQLPIQYYGTMTY